VTGNKQHFYLIAQGFCSPSRHGGGVINYTYSAEDKQKSSKRGRIFVAVKLIMSLSNQNIGA